MKMKSNKQRTSIRTTIALVTALLVLSTFAPKMLRARADSEDAQFQFATSNAGPRELEETTQKAIQRQYAAAWKNMDAALKDNRVDLLDQTFVGTIRDQLAKQIEGQKKSGISTRYVDKGHQISVLFYSPEGTALQLRDTADVEQQTLDGGKIIHTEQVRQQYLVIFTLVEDKWKVRIFQAMPVA